MKILHKNIILKKKICNYEILNYSLKLLSRLNIFNYIFVIYLLQNLSQLFFITQIKNNCFFTKKYKNIVLISKFSKFKLKELTKVGLIIGFFKKH